MENKKEDSDKFLDRIRDNTLTERDKCKNKTILDEGEVILRIGSRFKAFSRLRSIFLLSGADWNPSVIGLNFDSTEFKKGAAESIGNTLRENKTLKILSFRKSKFNGDSVNPIIQSLRENTIIERLYFDAKNITNEDAEDLLAILENRENITLLDVDVIGKENLAPYLMLRIKKRLTFNRLLKSIRENTLDFMPYPYNFEDTNNDGVLDLSGEALAYEDLKMLLEALPNGTAINSVKLNLNNLNAKDKKSIRAIAIQRNVTILDEKPKAMRPGDLYAALRTNSTQEVLLLEESESQTVDFREIIESLRDNTTLRELYVDVDAITNGNARALAEMLEMGGNTTLTYTNIVTSKKIDANLLKRIKRRLVFNRILKSITEHQPEHAPHSYTLEFTTIENNVLDLSKADLLFKDFKMLIAAIPKGTSITGVKLKIDYLSPVDQRSVRILFARKAIAVLEQAPGTESSERLFTYYYTAEDEIPETLSLTESESEAAIVRSVTVENRSSTSSFVTGLFERLRREPSITSLSFNSMQFKAAAVEQIAEELENNTTLRVLSFRESNLSDDDINTIIPGLIGNTILEELYLNRNNITNEGAEALAEMLESGENTSLLQLSIARNKGILKIGKEKIKIKKATIKRIEKRLDINMLLKCIKENRLDNLPHPYRFNEDGANVLDLSEAELGHKDWTMLVEAIPEGTSITNMRFTSTRPENEHQERTEVNTQENVTNLKHRLLEEVQELRYRFVTKRFNNYRGDRMVNFVRNYEGEEKKRKVLRIQSDTTHNRSNREDNSEVRRKAKSNPFL